MVHPYGTFTASYTVTTEYGTFALCASCLLAGHLGTKRSRSRNVATPLPFTERPRCSCEHVTHFPKETER